VGAVETLIHTYAAVHVWTAHRRGDRPTTSRFQFSSAYFRTRHRRGQPPGELLLHMCGRIPLGYRPRQTDWRWYGAVPDAGPTNAP
jgi:hypothetical protein